MINTIRGLKVFEQAMLEIANPARGIMVTGWGKFNDLLGGFRPHEFTIFCAATGSGKTQWLATVVAKVITHGEIAFVASVETGHTDFAKRIMSVLAGKDLNTGAAVKTQDYSPAVSEHFEALDKNVIFSTHENRVDVMEMVATLRYMCEVEKVTIAVLDNLNFFLKPTGANNVIMEYDEAVHSFVMLAKEIPMHIILVMHPKKSDGKLTSEFDIKGSSTAVQEASNVILMNRLDEDEVPRLGNMFTREFVFKKIRKRGHNINRKFYMKYVGSAYVES